MYERSEQEDYMRVSQQIPLQSQRGALQIPSIPRAPSLRASLECMQRALAHLSMCSFPLWDCHAKDVMVENDTGHIKVLDWSGGPSSDSGNISLLPTPTTL